MITWTLPYTYSLFPLFMGLMISTTTYDEFIKLSFPHIIPDPKKDSYNLMWEMACAFFPIGGFIGSFTSDVLSRTLGSRKWAIVVYEVLGITGTGFYILSYTTGSFTCFFVFRFLFGLAAGSYMSITLVQVFELTDPKHQKAIALVIQPFINLGILITSFFSLKIINHGIWVINICPLAVGQLIMLPITIYLPESPVWLYQKKNDLKAARDSLERLRRPGADIDTELDEINKSALEASSKGSATFMQLLRYLPLRLPLLVTIIAVSCQQLSGINIIIMYTTNFMKEVRFTLIDVGCFIVMVVCFMASIFFALVIPFKGPKFWMIFGYTGMSIAFFFGSLGVLFHWSPVFGLVCICLFIAIFQSGPGSCTWTVFKQTFSLYYQPSAQVILATFNWTFNVIVMAGSNQLALLLNINSMLMFSILNGVWSLMLFVLMVEVKDKTPDQVIADYKKRYRLR